jgi:Ca2+/H+ antiporter, TMEM165/GDT1 family
MMDWTQAGTPVVASFLASTVEFVEALTVVLAVGMVRGWRPALFGAVAAALALSLMVLALGPSLTLIPLDALQLLVGLLLLLFGLRWLRKAILRAAGVIALHDEAAFRGTTEELRRAHGRRWLGLDAVVFGTL